MEFLRAFLRAITRFPIYFAGQPGKRRTLKRYPSVQQFKIRFSFQDPCKLQMTRSRAQSIKCEQFWRLANQESVILPSLERKLRKKMPSVSTNKQSVIFPPCVIKREILFWQVEFRSVISENRKLLSFSLR